MEQIQVSFTEEQIKRMLALLSQGKYSDVADLISILVVAVKRQEE